MNDRKFNPGDKVYTALGGHEVTVMDDIKVVDGKWNYLVKYSDGACAFCSEDGLKANLWTMEARAKVYADGMYPDIRDRGMMAHVDCRKDYLHGAQDQRKIDIEAACKLYREKCILAHEIIVSNLNLKAIRCIGINVEESVAAFRREMEVMI